MEIRKEAEIQAYHAPPPPPRVIIDVLRSTLEHRSLIALYFTESSYNATFHNNSKLEILFLFPTS